MKVQNKKKPKQTKKILFVSGMVFAAIQLICSGLFYFFAAKSEMLPTLYQVVLIVVLALLLGIIIALQFKKIPGIIGKVLSIIISAILLTGSWMFYTGLETIGDLISNVKTDQMNVYVLKEDNAENLEDIKDYSFGTLGIDSENTVKMVDELKKELNVSELKTKDFDNIGELVDNLYDKKLGAIILNKAYIDIITEQEEHADFLDRVKLITNKSIKTEIPTEEAKSGTNSEVKEFYTIYLSGNDTSGKISDSNRSDVNIIAFVNVKSGQILLLSTPRDSYVPLAKNNQKDKLTHAGLYGVKESISTLEKIYGINIDYYFKMNFSGFKGIVDALGGIEIESPKAFTSSGDQPNERFHFDKGINKVNGAKALAFVRERAAFTDGDLQREADQMVAIQAIFKKATSPSVLPRFNNLMQEIKKYIQTDMSMDEMSTLVKLQLEKSPSWNFVTYTPGGTSMYAETYSWKGKQLWVLSLDKKDITYAVDLITQVKNGETLKQEDIKKNSWN